ncbi:hypothetical protein QFX18_19060 [Saccharophagus degradans]|uniref:hypothetical protein n=1 Tax=Saccharophagus degradans TaxID=86304 RepID=UPI00247801A6|nr:hypothetical protein [Saccharophagus degradans]WGO98109.1 hypothetical protein QFX18_19060 [Saccharophagus degradans]
MKEWLDRVRASLSKAIQAVELSDDIPRENMYILAPLFYSQENNMNSDHLLKRMCEEIDEQFREDCSHDENSKYQFKFHYVSSYLQCYVVAGKIDEMKFDRIMDYVNGELELFDDGYEIE